MGSCAGVMASVFVKIEVARVRPLLLRKAALWHNVCEELQHPRWIFPGPRQDIMKKEHHIHTPERSEWTYPMNPAQDFKQVERGEIGEFIANL